MKQDMGFISKLPNFEFRAKSSKYQNALFIFLLLYANSDELILFFIKPTRSRSLLTSNNLLIITHGFHQMSLKIRALLGSNWKLNFLELPNLIFTCFSVCFEVRMLT